MADGSLCGHDGRRKPDADEPDDSEGNERGSRYGNSLTISDMTKTPAAETRLHGGCIDVTLLLLVTRA